MKLYKEQKNTIYELRVSISDFISAILSSVCLFINTLYNYARGRTDIDKMQIGTLISIARLEHKEPMELYNDMKTYLERK